MLTFHVQLSPSYRLKQEMSSGWSRKLGSRCLPSSDWFGKTCQTKIRSVLNAKRRRTLARGKSSQLEIAPHQSVPPVPFLVRFCSILRNHAGFIILAQRQVCFLDPDFGNSRRAQFRKLYPKATNGEISSMLAKEWMKAPYEVKKEYIEREARLREQYKRDIAAWIEANKRGTRPPSEQGNNMLEDEDPIEYEELERPVLVKRGGDDPENDKKPPAVEGKSQRQDQETSSTKTGHMEVSQGHCVPRLGHVVQSVGEYKLNDTSSRQSKYAARSKSGGSDTSFSSDETPLAPLTSTDIGAFLAAAAMLDAPDQGKEHMQYAQDDERISKLPASTTGAAAKGRTTMKSSVRKVVSKLPPDSMQDEDLP